MKVLAATFFSLLFIAPCFGHNNLFLPGDAFFSSVLKEDILEKKNPGDNLSISYRRYYGDFMACGYFGYGKLTLKSLPKIYFENLSRLRSKLFSTYKGKAQYYEERLTRFGKEHKVHYFPLLIYNRDYDLNQLLFLKYNENWKQVQTIEGKRSHAIYDKFPRKGSIERDKRYANQVPPLKIDSKRPSIIGDAFDGVGEPITIEAKKIQFIVILEGFGNHYLGKDGLVFFTISETIDQYVYKDGKVQRIYKEFFEQ